MCSADKQFKQYWNFSHELLNEQNHQQVMDDCLQFVVARLPHDV
jgi:alpha-beta hydrolase superfamily lysophospholipase